MTIFPSQGGDDSDAEDEDDLVDGSELAALGSVFECDRINTKKMSNEDGWECGW